MIKSVLRRVIDLGAAAAAAGVWLAGPAVVHASAQPDAATVYTVTPERIAASTAALVGLISAVIGGLALFRSGRRIGNRGRRGAILALALGPVGLLVGGLVVAAAEGGVGTGKGVAGGIVAMVVAVIGMALGGLALARARRRAGAGNVID